MRKARGFLLVLRFFHLEGKASDIIRLSSRSTVDMVHFHCHFKCFVLCELKDVYWGLNS